MKKILILLQILFISTFTSIAFASELDEFTPDNEFCKTIDRERLLQGSDQEIIKSCKCFNIEELRKNIPASERSEATFSEICRDVNIKYNCIYKNESDSIITIDKIKTLDQNNNCLLDTNREKCLAKLANLMKTSPERTNNARRDSLFGCYGNSLEPKNLIDYQGEDRNINNFEIFNDEKGLIANNQQKTQLKKLTENQAGPVISFINMIIDYLVGIIFVICLSSLIYGGYNLIFAGFDSDMKEKGKNAIKYAIAGFFFVMLSYTIVLLVQSIF